MHETTRTLVTDGGTQPGSQEHAQDFVEKVMGGANYTETFVVELDDEDDELEFQLSPIADREQLYEYMSDLPGGWFRASQKDDVSEVEDVQSLIPNGAGVKALHNLLCDSISHPHLPPMDIETLVKEGFATSVLTQMGIQVVQMSEETKNISSFRRE